MMADCGLFSTIEHERTQRTFQISIFDFKRFGWAGESRIVHFRTMGVRKRKVFVIWNPSLLQRLDYTVGINSSI
jgi:hypothetical protein